MNELLDLFEAYVGEYENEDSVIFLRKDSTFVLFETSSECKAALYDVAKGMCMGYNIAKQQDGRLYVEDYEKEVNGHIIYMIEFRED